MGIRENGRIGTDFVSQFTSELQTRRVFCLLDSSHARASKWVQKECGIAFACRNIVPEFDFVPCLIHPYEKDDRWLSKELFAGKNRLSYLDLTHYEAGIHKLCKHLEAVYFPYSDVERDCDFWSEIQVLGLDRDHLQELEEVYERYRKARGSRPEAASRWLKELIEQLFDLGSDTVISP